MTDPLYRKVTLRLIPFLFVCQVMAAIDRTNIGYAQLQLGRDLGFSNLIYGTGASLFSLACFLFEVPGNLLLERIGARKSIGRIMILWGIASAGTLFVQSPGQFYFARFLLGCFEAGFAPGVFLYITYWYPQDRRARAAGYILSAIVTAGIIGGPISGLILVGLNGAWGLRGWQWMFLIEGLPATLLGIVAWFYLDDRPSQARWLSEAEKAAIAAEVKSVGRVRGKLGEVMRDPRVWTLGLMYLAVLGAGHVLNYWLPVLIRDAGESDIRRIGMLSALPYIAALWLMNWFARRSDLKRERRRHFFGCVLVSSVALALSSVVSGNLPASMLTLTLAGAFLSASFPVFWAVSTGYLPVRNAAAGLALIASLGHVGSIASGWLIGWLRETTGSAASGLYVTSFLLAMAGVLMVAAAPREGQSGVTSHE